MNEWDEKKIRARKQTTVRPDIMTSGHNIGNIGGAF